MTNPQTNPRRSNPHAFQDLFSVSTDLMDQTEYILRLEHRIQQLELQNARLFERYTRFLTELNLNHGIITGPRVEELLESVMYKNAYQQHLCEQQQQVLNSQLLEHSDPPTRTSLSFKQQLYQLDSSPQSQFTLLPHIHQLQQNLVPERVEQEAKAMMDTALDLAWLAAYHKHAPHPQSSLSPMKFNMLASPQNPSYSAHLDHIDPHLPYPTQFSCSLSTPSSTSQSTSSRHSYDLTHATSSTLSLTNHRKTTPSSNPGKTSRPNQPFSSPTPQQSSQLTPSKPSIQTPQKTSRLSLIDRFELQYAEKQRTNAPILPSTSQPQRNSLNQNPGMMNTKFATVSSSNSNSTHSRSTYSTSFANFDSSSYITPVKLTKKAALAIPHHQPLSRSCSPRQPQFRSSSKRLSVLEEANALATPQKGTTRASQVAPLRPIPEYSTKPPISTPLEAVNQLKSPVPSTYIRNQESGLPSLKTPLPEPPFNLSFSIDFDTLDSTSLTPDQPSNAPNNNHLICDQNNFQSSSSSLPKSTPLSFSSSHSSQVKDDRSFHSTKRSLSALSACSIHSHTPVPERRSHRAPMSNSSTSLSRARPSQASHLQFDEKDQIPIPTPATRSSFVIPSSLNPISDHSQKNPHNLDFNSNSIRLQPFNLVNDMNSNSNLSDDSDELI